MRYGFVISLKNLSPFLGHGERFLAQGAEEPGWRIGPEPLGGAGRDAQASESDLKQLPPGNSASL